MNILLVDDEKKFAMMLARRLDLRGFRIHFACTGHEAVEMVTEGKRFYVAILDVKMPGMDGIELRRRLQSLDPDMKFIFLTGHGSDIHRSVGADEEVLFLPKPLKIDELVNALLKLSGNEAEKTAGHD